MIMIIIIIIIVIMEKIVIIITFLRLPSYEHYALTLNINWINIRYG